MKIAFLCSGAGGNLAFVYRAIERGWLSDHRICAVLADRECQAVDFARKHLLDAGIADFSFEGQVALARRLLEFEPDYVITTVHRILSPAFVSALRHRLINIHYSLLPSFGGSIGITPLRKALTYGAKFVGVTVHEVDEGVDSGVPLSQAITAVPMQASEERLMNTLFRAGCLCLFEVLSRRNASHPDSLVVAGKSVEIAGNMVQFNPPLPVSEIFHNERFWNDLLLSH